MDLDAAASDLRGFDPGNQALLFQPDIVIAGPITAQLEREVTTTLRDLRQFSNQAIIEMTTSGGDADAGRRIAAEIVMFRKFGGKVCIIGRTTVYSAGVTIFSAVPPDSRFLSGDTMLMVHERRMERKVDLSGPLSSCLQLAREELATIEASIRLETEGFADFIRGSQVTLQDVRTKAKHDWYIRASEALDLGLVSRVIPTD